MTSPEQTARRIRTVTLSGRRTSLRLEHAVWDALDDILRRERQTLNQLLTSIDATKEDASLAACVRVFVVLYFRNLTKEA